MKLIFATRPSALARRQTQWIISALQDTCPHLECEVRIFTTRGDQIPDQPLPEIGGKGLFTQELEEEILKGNVHCAVHSLKDLPLESPAGLTIGCIPLRADARDVLISKAHLRLADLPPNARIGTSSLRRAAQLLAARPDLHLTPLRGNVDTRLRKVHEGQLDAIVIAGAGLTRLGLDSQATEWLPLEVMLPAPGQGALAVQCRAEDSTILEILATLEDTPTRLAVTAERAFLQGVGGGCSLPVAAYAWHEPQSAALQMIGLVISEDAKTSIRVTGEGTNARQLGERLAREALELGAREILHSTNHHPLP